MNEQDVTSIGADDLPQGISRRDLMIKGGSLAALAWAAPAITRLPGSYARGTELEQAVVVDTTDAGQGSLNVPDGTVELRVHLWGAGGSGGTGGPGASQAGAGGGGGGYRLVVLTGSLASSYNYAVGLGGPAQTANNTAGTAGGNTWFDEDAAENRASGGGAGSSAGGTGGTPGTGDIPGGSGRVRPTTSTGGGGGGSAGSGTRGLPESSDSSATGGAGGTGTFPGNDGGTGVNGAGNPGTGYGAGGSGGRGTSGAGANGRILVFALS